jgi:hypothetical protein
MLWQRENSCVPESEPWHPAHSLATVLTVTELSQYLLDEISGSHGGAFKVMFSGHYALL